MRTASGTRPAAALPRAIPHDEEDLTKLYETQNVEIIESEPVALMAQLRRARICNWIMGAILFAEASMAFGWWLRGGR